MEPTLRPLDLRTIEDLFEMGGGYVLDFTNQTFSEFFLDELRVDINDPRYAVDGGSKGKRLRRFLRESSPAMRVRTVQALFEYRRAYLRRPGKVDPIPNSEGEYRQLIDNLRGLRRTPKPADSPTVAEPSIAGGIDLAAVGHLAQKLVDLTGLDPHRRGYEYERFLRDLFAANGLAAHAGFRNVGEQIDGSFQLNSETYLLEAKWTAAMTGAADLRSFNAKVEDKAAWSRGLFVSHSGFSGEGLAAFGRGKRVICMDGLDLYDMLDRKLAFAEVLARKLRRAAERGEPFSRVRDLF